MSPYREAYSAGLRAKVVQQLLGPAAKTLTSVSKDTGIPPCTLYRWRREATLQRVPTANDEDDDDAGAPKTTWTSAQKLMLVLQASSIPATELGEFLRRKGLHEAQLRAWREQALAGLDEERERRAGGDGRRIRELERELQRKDRALAEAAALLLLKKKVLEIWGDGDDDTEKKNEP
jgi:transposase